MSKDGYSAVYRKCIKRILDIVFSSITIIVASPLFVIIGIAELGDVGFPVFFRQQRVGYKERCFNILKFRSMRNECDSKGFLLPDSERVTRIGAFLRHSSLDELPQLFNVLKGDMSIVGPRPLPPSYLPYYRPEERIRHSVRPGITGLAQINGRTALTWDKKLELDVQYVNTMSFWLDCKIVFHTISKVIRRSDIRDSAIEGPISQCRQIQCVGHEEADYDGSVND